MVNKDNNRTDIAKCNISQYYDLLHPDHKPGYPGNSRRDQRTLETFLIPPSAAPDVYKLSLTGLDEALVSSGARSDHTAAVPAGVSSRDARDEF